jgi:magnesium-transporting ATPase (P-type)
VHHYLPWNRFSHAVPCCALQTRSFAQQCTQTNAVFPLAASFTLQSTGKNTFFGKTATMLQSADGLGHLQKILMSIVVALVVISLVLCITMLIYLLTYGKENIKEALTFVVVVLVVSIPIAIEIVCTTTLAIGSRQVGVGGCWVCVWGRGHQGVRERGQSLKLACR